ncbi:VanZ family protein [Litorimonas taeanensis]|nr:VanZ family protein [Litorimonas taeanensis]
MMKNGFMTAVQESKFTIWTARILCLLTMGLVVWKSLAQINLPNSFNNMDKVLHFGAYFTVCGLALLARFSKRALITVFAVILMGVIIEFLQGTMNIGRSISFWDAVANSAGAFLAFSIWLLFQARPDKASTSVSEISA